MSEKTPAKTKNKPPGIFSALIFAVFKTLAISVMAWLVLIIWFLVQAIVFDQNRALQQAQSIVLLNINFISENISPLTKILLHNFLVSHQAVLNFVNQWTLLQNPVAHHAVNLLMAVTEITLSRLLVFLSALPLFVLIVLVFVTDGLVKRDIRKFQGARETTFIFHRTKNLWGFCFFVPLFIYLSLPLSLMPTLFLLVQALLLGMVAMLSATYFKKYV